MVRTRTGLIVFLPEGDIIGAGCGVGTFVFDPYNAASRWGGSVTGDPAEAILSADQFTFKLNAGSLDSTFVITQLHLMQITGGTYYAFQIPTISIAGAADESVDNADITIEYTIDGGTTWGWANGYGPAFVNIGLIETRTFASGSLPIGVDERFGIRITIHLLSPDALEPTITIALPEYYCCAPLPDALDMGSVDYLPDEPTSPTDPGGPECFFAYTIAAAPCTNTFTFTINSWTYRRDQAEFCALAGEAVVTQRDACVFDMGLCRNVRIEFDVVTGVLPDRHLYFRVDGSSFSEGTILEDGSFDTGGDPIIDFAGHVDTDFTEIFFQSRWLRFGAQIHSRDSFDTSISNIEVTVAPLTYPTFFTEAQMALP
jgi:hypothetical protein